MPNSPIIQVKDDAKNAKEVDNHSIPKHIKQEDREDDEIVPERNVEREDEMNDSGGEYEWIT